VGDWDPAQTIYLRGGSDSIFLAALSNIQTRIFAQCVRNLGEILTNPRLTIPIRADDQIDD